MSLATFGNVLRSLMFGGGGRRGEGGRGVLCLWLCAQIGQEKTLHM